MAPSGPPTDSERGEGVLDLLRRLGVVLVLAALALLAWLAARHAG